MPSIYTHIVKYLKAKQFCLKFSDWSRFDVYFTFETKMWVGSEGEAAREKTSRIPSSILNRETLCV